MAAAMVQLPEYRTFSFAQGGYSLLPPENRTYAIAQGATLIVPFALYVDGLPAFTTGSIFRGTLKLHPDIPDEDPSVVMIDWVGGQNAPPDMIVPEAGIEYFVVPAEVTYGMRPGTWRGLVRTLGVHGIPLVSDVLHLIVMVTKPISARF